MDDWVQIKEFPRYSINDEGVVRNDRTARIMKPRDNGRGHLVVNLMGAGRQSTRSIAKLVCDAFVPNPRPEYFTTPIHLNGDLFDCSAYNLTWRPRWFANSYTRQFRIGYRNTPPIRDVRTGEVFPGIWELVIAHGVLYREVIDAIPRNAKVFPTNTEFSWLD